MSDLVSVKTEELTPEELGGEIRLLTRQARQMVLEYGIQIGYRLYLAKEKVGSDFAGWVERETDISKSSAYRFIKLYTEYGSAQGSLLGVENLFPTLGKVSISNALRLLAVPEEEREEFAQEVDAEHISARELEEAIRERDSARAKLEDTEAALKDQRTKREDAESAAQDMERMLRETEKKLKEAESRPIEVAVDEDAVRRAAEKAKEEAKREASGEIASLRSKLETAQRAERLAQENLKSAEEKARTVAKSAEEKAKREAEEAKKEAERDAERLRSEAEALRKKLESAESGANEVILLVRLAQENFNLAVEKLKVMKETHPKTAEKLLAGTKKILEGMVGKCG